MSIESSPEIAANAALALIAAVCSLLDCQLAAQVFFAVFQVCAPKQEFGSDMNTKKGPDIKLDMG